MDNKPRLKLSEKIFIFLKYIVTRLSQMVDKLLFSGKSTVIVSLLLSIFICVAIDYENISFQLFNDTTTTVTVSNVAVDVLYDSDLYEVSNIPSTVEVSLTGDATDIQIFRQQGDITVTVDLRKSSAGENIVDFTVDSLPTNITAKTSPSSAKVVLEKKVTKQFTISSELLVGSNQKSSDFNISSLSQKTVSITGTESTLETIRIVKALVDTTGQVQDFETDAKLVAYDANGNVLNVTIEPTTVHAVVKMVSENE